jgi:hypothetical protein
MRHAPDGRVALNDEGSPGRLRVTLAGSRAFLGVLQRIAVGVAQIPATGSALNVTGRCQNAAPRARRLLRLLSVKELSQASHRCDPTRRWSPAVGIPDHDDKAPRRNLRASSSIRNGERSPLSDAPRASVARWAKVARRRPRRDDVIPPHVDPRQNGRSREPGQPRRANKRANRHAHGDRYDDDLRPSGEHAADHPGPSRARRWGEPPIDSCAFACSPGPRERRSVALRTWARSVKPIIARSAAEYGSGLWHAALGRRAHLRLAARVPPATDPLERLPNCTRRSCAWPARSFASGFLRAL